MEVHPMTARVLESRELRDTATHVVSYWYLPGGYRADQARVRFAFFENEDEAKRFEQKHADRPAMASLMTRQQYDEMISKIDKAFK